MGLAVLETEYRSWAIVLASIVVHGTVFTLLHTFLSRTLFGGLYNKLTTREQMRFDERMVAMLHACVSCQGSIRAFFSVLPQELTVKNIVFLSGAFAFVLFHISSFSEHNTPPFELHVCGATCDGTELTTPSGS